MFNLEVSKDKSQEVTSTDETSLLVIILDTNPGQKLIRENTHALTQCMESVITFGNAHLMQKAQNKLAIMACHSKTRFANRIISFCDKRLEKSSVF